MPGINMLQASIDAMRKEQQNATKDREIEKDNIIEHQDGSAGGETTEAGRGDSHEQSGEVEQEKEMKNAEETRSRNERENAQETQRRKKHR